MNKNICRYSYMNIVFGGTQKIVMQKPTILMTEISFFLCKSISDYSIALLCHRKLFHSVFMFWRQNILFDYTSLYLPILYNDIITEDINIIMKIYSKSHKLSIQE